MRVITGTARGRRLGELKGQETRPTTGKVKEGVFSALQFDIEGRRVLDLFAGTGSITAEFLSRGSHFVSSVELDREHCAFIASVLRTLGADNARLHRYDALRYITHSSDTYDIIFADPPYKLPRLGEIPSLVLSSPILRPDGLLILEHGKNYDFSALPGFFDHRAYGSVNFSFFRHPAPAAE